MPPRLRRRYLPLYEDADYAICLFSPRYCWLRAPLLDDIELHIRHTMFVDTAIMRHSFSPATYWLFAPSRFIYYDAIDYAITIYATFII